MFGWLKKEGGKPAQPRSNPSRPAANEPASEPVYEVALSGGQFTLDYAGQPQVRAALGDVSEIVVETTPGPSGAEVWWLLLGGRSELLMAFPQSAKGQDAVAGFLQALGGFDHARFDDAMGCATDGEFLVWRRPAASNP